MLLQFSISINLLNNIHCWFFSFWLTYVFRSLLFKELFFDTPIFLAPPCSSYVQQDFNSSLVHLTLDNLENLLSPGFCGTLTSIFSLSTSKSLPSLKDASSISAFWRWLCYCPNGNSPIGGSFYPLPLSRYTVARFIFLDKTINHGPPFSLLLQISIPSLPDTFWYIFFR